MTRILRYLKPYTGLIVMAVFLLFIQAMADLSLPDYMSKIVNDGIQQGGVENAVPKAIRQSEMDRVVLFLSAEDRQTVLDNYTLVDQNTADYDQLVKDYPALADQPVYILNDADRDAISTLNPIMAKALLIVSGLEQAIADPAKAAEMGINDLSRIPPGMDLFSVIPMLPPAQLEPMMEQINSRFDTMGEKLIIQSATRVVKAEYSALGVDTDRMQNRYIINIGLLMLGITMISGLSTVTVGFLSARTASGVTRDLRHDVFRKVSSFSSTEFDRFSTASLITRSTNDMTQIQMTVMIAMRMLFFAPIMGVGGVIRAVGKSPSMSWIIALAVLVLIGLIVVTFSATLPRFRVIQTLIDRLNLVTRENLSGMMVIRAFNTQRFEEDRFDQANRDVTDMNLFVNRVMASMMPLMMLIMNGMSVAIIWVGAHLVAESQLQVGDMMAFMQYAMQIVMSFLFISFMFIILPRASVSADRIAEVLAVTPAIQDAPQPKAFPEPFRGTVEFRGVSFRYPHAEEDVLHQINFTAQPGQTTAIIGSTGSGKSTVINLIPRFYDVTSGSILIDGMDVREVSQADLHRRIGYIPQKGLLFTGTIDSNLRYADENV
ncbi:MAG: ABC transporter ATP-binding protein, partial [Anaerolineae bacterium]|nr:ABC transporter ATP-binding protein [Anaerolineae bacterium]